MSKLMVGCAPARRVRGVLSLALAAALLGAPAAAHAGGWLSPQSLSDPSGDIEAPEVAQTPGGTTIAVWQRTRLDDPDDPGSDSHVVLDAAVRPPGGSFDVPKTLSDPAANARTPQLAVDALGNAAIVWIRDEIVEIDPETTDTLSRVMVAFRPGGGSFGAPQVLSSATEAAGAADVAFDSSGQVVVLWGSNDGNSNAFVRGARGPFGGSLTAFSSPIHSEAAAGGGTASSAFGPPVELVSDADGGVHAAWLRRRNSTDLTTFALTLDSSVQVSRRPKNPTTRLAQGGFPAPTTLASAQTVIPAGGDPQGDALTDLDIAANPAGRSVVAWGRAGGAQAGVEAAASEPAPATFGAPGSISAAGTGDPTVVDAGMDAQGRATVVWGMAGVDGTRVESSVRPPGGPFGPPVRLSEDGMQADEPELAVAPDGRAVAVWRNLDFLLIEGAARPAGEAFGEPRPVSDQFADFDPQTPRLSIDAKGNSAAVWRDGVDGNVRLGVFDGEPPVLTGATFPGSGTAGDTLDFSASATDTWSDVSFDWTFGDGDSDTGPQVSHTYADGGVFTPMVTAIDGGGNTATALGTTTIASPPDPIVPTDPGDDDNGGGSGGGRGGTGGSTGGGSTGGGSTGGSTRRPDRTAPRVESFGMRKRTFAVAREPTPTSAALPPLGSAFRFELSEEARVSIVIERENSGLRVGATCRRATPRLRRQLERRLGRGNLRALRCVLPERVGRLRRSGSRGANTVVFSGRIGRFPLRVAYYRATIVATDAAGNVSDEQRTRFRIVRPRPRRR